MCFKKCKLLCDIFWLLKGLIRIWVFMLNNIFNSYCSNLIAIVKLPCLIHRLPLNYISAHMQLLSDFFKKMSSIFNILGKFFFHCFMVLDLGYVHITINVPLLSEGIFFLVQKSGYIFYYLHQLKNQAPTAVPWK